MEETSLNPYKVSCREFFKNMFDDTIEDSYEAPSQDHLFLKALKEDDTEVNSLTHNQLFKLRV